MYSNIIEMFLYEYFSFDVILGDFCNRKELFFALSELFWLQKKETESLFEGCESQSVKDINSVNEYYRFKRIQQYNLYVGRDSLYPEKQEKLIAIKGMAIVDVKNSLKTNEKSTKMTVVKTLMSNAEKGSVLALKILGIMQCAGIVLSKDKENGIKNLKKAMRWGQVTATLAMLKYSDVDKVKILKILHSAVKSTPYEFLQDLAESRCKVSCNGEYSQEILLLKKVINASQVNKDIYNPIYERTIFSEVLDIKDREQIVFSRELLSVAKDLPLCLQFNDISIDGSCVEKFSIAREDEMGEIINCLSNNDLRTIDTYRPICISSNSDYVLKSYISIIPQILVNTHVEVIDVAELSEADFELTKDNVFIRGLKENTNNVYILVFKGDVSNDTIELVQNILRSDKRSKFRLKLPPIGIDLSSVLPICICDRDNARRLGNYVKQIEILPIQGNEKKSVIDDLLNKKSQVYSLCNVTVTKELMEKLCELPIENSESILDKVICENRKKGKVLELDIDIVKPYIQKIIKSKNSYGFGGAD